MQLPEFKNHCGEYQQKHLRKVKLEPIEKYIKYINLNDTSTYINVNSNHLSNIIKALPDSISKRIINISSDKGRFNNSAQFLTTYYLQVGTKKILLIKKICHLQIEQDKER